MDGSIRFVWGFPFLFVCIYDNMIEVQHCSAWRQGDLHTGLDCAQWRELQNFYYFRKTYKTLCSSAILSLTGVVTRFTLSVTPSLPVSFPFLHLNVAEEFLNQLWELENSITPENDGRCIIVSRPSIFWSLSSMYVL